MKVTVKVQGERELDREIRALSKKLGLKGGKFADFAAKAMKEGVVRNVQPFGTGKKAREKGERAVKSDLMRCFRIVGEDQRGRKGIISSMAEAKAWHRQRRNSKGRVRRGEKRSIVASVFGSYLEMVQKRVGMAKASMLGGGDARLGTRIQGWLKRWVNTGDAKRKRKSSGAVWTFSGEPEAVGDDRIMGVRGVNRVMRKQGRIVLGALKREMKKVLREANRRVNR